MWMEGGDSCEVLGEIHHFNGGSAHPLPRSPRRGRNGSEDYEWRSNHGRWVHGKTRHRSVRVMAKEALSSHADVRTIPLQLFIRSLFTEFRLPQLRGLACH